MSVVGPSKLKPGTSATFVCAARFEDGACSFTVSLTAGAREIALAREALVDSIRVGTSLDHVDAKPEIVAAPSADGANLVFTVKPPGTTQGFIAIRVR